MEEVPPAPEENAPIDHWIATESSSRDHAAKHGRESLGMIAPRELATARNRELTMRARGAQWGRRPQPRTKCCIDERCPRLRLCAAGPGDGEVQAQVHAG